jgi:hypothetical protein
MGLEEQGAGTYGGVVSNNEGMVWGDGGTPGNYGDLYRAFPGKTGSAGVVQAVFKAGIPNHVRIQAKWSDYAGGSDSGHHLEIRIYDLADADGGWILASIDHADLTTNWQDFAFKFTPSTTIIGENLKIQVRTLNTKKIQVDKLLVAQGDGIFGWTTSPEDHGEGYHGDFKRGSASGFTKGAWGSGPKKSDIA